MYNLIYHKKLEFLRIYSILQHLHRFCQKAYVIVVCQVWRRLRIINGGVVAGMYIIDLCTCAGDHDAGIEHSHCCDI